MRIQNFKRMKKRRGNFKIGVNYDTPVKKMRQIPEIIKKIIEKHELAEFNRAHFSAFGDFSLIFDIVYFVNSKEYPIFMDIQQAINFEIMETFEKEKIEMAFPTQTIYIKK